ncbi:hypothetical protein Q8A73_006115 [Channa argus]|nr:hypothetical protein Q8A73_006115 [Channa argus]
MNTTTKNHSCDDPEIQLPLSKALSCSTSVQAESLRMSCHFADKQRKSTAYCMLVYSPQFFPEIFATESFCSVDEAFLLPAEMQVRVSEDLNKEELNQNQLQSLGCIATGSVLQGFGTFFLVETVMLDD